MAEIERVYYKPNVRDCYTIVMSDGNAYASGGDGNFPQGFFMSIGPNEFVEGPNLGQMIDVSDLPEKVLRDVRKSEDFWIDEAKRLEIDLNAAPTPTGVRP